MITNARNKEEVSARDAFIIDKAKQGFSPTEILVLLKREGFQAPARSRIYQILERNSKKPINQRTK